MSSRSLSCTLSLRPIFRQLHLNFRGGRNANASEIWAQLTKNLLAKIKYKKIPRVHNLKKGKTIEYENMETDTGRFTGWDPLFYRSSIFSCRR